MRLRPFVRPILMSLLLGALAIRAATQDVGHPLARPAGVLRAGWPDLTGRVGPYGGIASADDARRMLADGLRLAVVSGASREVLTTLREGGAKYIDVRLWTLVSDVCRRQFAVETAARQPHACVMSAADEDQIVAKASAYLRTVEKDPALAGLWILDDFPDGDVTSVLYRLRNLVHQSNARSGFDRPTVCGVGGTLDYKRSPADASFIRDHNYMDQALRNVFPAACDIVSPYFYAGAFADDPRLVDWSMHDLLPYFEQALSARGYDMSSRILLPIAHAFAFHAAGGASYFVTPRPQDIATQMTAYCDSGAISMLFFTWRSADADRSYANDANLREGVQQGLAACRRGWQGGSHAP